MPVDIKRLNQLLEKASKDELSSEENDELNNYLLEEKKDLTRQLFEGSGFVIDELKKHHILLYQDEKTLKPNTVLPIDARRHRWLQYAAAAAVIAVVCVGIFLLQREGNPGKDYSQASQQERFKNEVPAATTGAVLTLANGRQIVLDDKSGTLVTEGNFEVTKEGETLKYQYKGDGDAETTKKQIAYNSVSTPRGRYITLTLSDGTKVWLNAASRLRYPVDFIGNERRVEITGEAYFDVAENEKKPFIVDINGVQIRVTGTQFNVNAYAEDGMVRTTLVEGAVTITKDEAHLNLTAGQQGVASNEQGKIILRREKEVNVEACVAWREGVFYFDDTSIEEIMKEISRWYDVEVKFKTSADKHYYINEARTEPLSKLLSIMEKAGNVRFVIEGRNILVIP